MTGQVWLTDINGAMLARGRDRLLDRGRVVPVRAVRRRTPAVSGRLFRLRGGGLRAAQHDAQGKRAGEMLRVLRTGGRLLVLEFSQVWKPLKPLYDGYSFKVLPLLGKLVAEDAGQLPLPRRVDSPPSRAGRTEADDGTGRLCTCRVLQSQRRSGGAAPRLQDLKPMLAAAFVAFANHLLESASWARDKLSLPRRQDCAVRRVSGPAGVLGGGGRPVAAGAAGSLAGGDDPPHAPDADRGVG